MTSSISLNTIISALQNEEPTTIIIVNVGRPEITKFCVSLKCMCILATTPHQCRTQSKLFNLCFLQSSCYLFPPDHGITLHTSRKCDRFDHKSVAVNPSSLQTLLKKMTQVQNRKFWNIPMCTI